MGISSEQISAMSGAVVQLSLTDLAANYSANMQAAIRSASDAIKQQDQLARKALAMSNADPPALLAQSLACLGAALLPATSCVVQAGAAVADAIATAAVRDPACSARLQEMLQATRMVNPPFHAATSCLASSSGASVQHQMGSPAVRPLPVQAAMVMEGLLQRCTAVLGAFPSSIAPGRHATLPHLQGYIVQSLVLMQACSLWALSLAAGGGHALLLAGQRQAAVVLASDLLAK